MGIFPILNLLFGHVFHDAMTLLNFSNQLISLAVDNGHVIVGQFASLLFDLAGHLFPIAFDRVFVHVHSRVVIKTLRYRCSARVTESISLG